ncbi:antitoxin family protein [Spirulina major]|uniref:antitoxin family protein n=1 Tax=Spirulina major TaxID=270636 RepID=UPI000933A6E7|nr:antitoxin family protein [Spirulina major]
MQQTIKAIHENGILRPLQSLDLSEGQEVELVITSPDQIDPRQMLQLASAVYQEFSPEQIDDIEKIALDRQNFFKESVNS